MPAALDRALSGAVAVGDSPETIRTKRLLAGALLVSLPIIAFSVVQLVLLRAPVAGAVIAIAFVTNLGCLVVMRVWPASYPGVMHLIALINIAISAAEIVIVGGLLASGVNSVWGLLAVVGALAVFGDRRANLWLVFYIVINVVAVIVASRVEPIESLPNADYIALFNLLAVVVFVYGILFYYVRQRAILLDQSDSLLRNVLPDEVADRLKTSTATIAESFDEASILSPMSPVSLRCRPG